MTLDQPKTVQKKNGNKRSETKVKKEKRDFSEVLLRVALRTTRSISKPLSRRIPALTQDILRSNLNTSPEGIIALALFFTLLSIPVSILGIFEMYRLDFYLGILPMPLISVLALIAGLNIPKISASSRASALENELPYLIGYITVLAGGGISPLVTIKRISRAESIFPAASKEARRILLDIEVFGLDAISALERASRYTPNRMFSDFIGGYVAVLKTGGDAVSYLESKLREVFNYRESRVRSSSEFIGTMAEAYIISTVVMGISFMILFATSNLMSAGVTSVDPTMIIMFSGLFVPVISMIFITVIGSAQIKEPFGYDLPYYVFLACTPIAAAFFFLPIPLALYTRLGIGLILTSSPAMIINSIHVKRKREVEAKLSSFLRDISEVRKTGLAPEKTIEQLAGRDYGGLSKYVKQISSQLSWGTPIRVVLSNFSSSAKSWLTQAMAFLLLEVVDVGGGSPRMFVSLADFTEKNAQLEKERKSLIRPYVIIPYIGAILVVATTAMMIYFVSAPNLTFPGSTGNNYLPSQSVINQATTILLTASFFQAWIMGMVAGKMGESTVADGFKHATALVMISLITVYISSFMISFSG
ncbi:MAG: type II secretion system F family protein [Nitrososphaerales archaeon]